MCHLRVQRLLTINIFNYYKFIKIYECVNVGRRGSLLSRVVVQSGTNNYYLICGDCALKKFLIVILI